MIRYACLRAGQRSWSEWQDLNLRPPRPERGALPDCATLRRPGRSIYTWLARPFKHYPKLDYLHDMQHHSVHTATQVLQAGPDAVEAAARVLAHGGLVAFPTETVYGLGADAGNGEAVARLYAAKGRPAFNPLIAHMASAAAAPKLARFDTAAERLAAAFWPGPLTLVLPKAADCPV